MISIQKQIIMKILQNNYRPMLSAKNMRYEIPRTEFPEVEWKPLKYHDIRDCYLISNYGDLFNTATNKMYKPRTNSKYLEYQLCGKNMGKRKFILAHILVCSTFNGKKPFKDAEVNHKNHVTRDNRSINLEWVTFKENSDHNNISISKNNLGENNPFAKYSDELCVKICKRATVKYSTYYEILDDLHLPRTQAYYTLVKKLIKRKTRNHISINYKFYKD